MGPKPANAALFNGNGDFMGGKQLADQLFVQRFGEAQVSDGGGQALRLQYVGGLQRLLQSRTQRENGDLLAFPHDTALANGKTPRDGRKCGYGAISARIGTGARTANAKGAGMHHLNKHDIVRSSPPTNVRQGGKQIEDSTERTMRERWAK